MDTICVSAPGKVILHGEHAVVYGKTAIASSLNLRCFLRATPRTDGLVVLDMPDVSTKRQWTIENLQKDLFPKLHDFQVQDLDNPLPPSEENLLTLKEFAGISHETVQTPELAIIAFLYLFSKILLCGETQTVPAMEFRLISHLPVGAGLGSSAAFSVCIASVLLQHAGKISRVHSKLFEASCTGPGDSDIQSNLPLAGWSPDEKLAINKWAFLGEKIIHGHPSGIDNSISSLGGAIKFQNKQITPVVKMPELKILLTNTKVPRSTKTLVAGVKHRFDKYPGVMVPLLDAIEGVANESMAVYSSLCIESENNEAFDKLQELIDMNQYLLGAMGVSHANLENVIAITAQYGLHTKLTGAGGGGCTYTLLSKNINPDTVRKVCQELHKAGYECWETSIGAPGVMYHSYNDHNIPQNLLK